MTTYPVLKTIGYKGNQNKHRSINSKSKIFRNFQDPLKAKKLHDLRNWARSVKADAKV